MKILVDTLPRWPAECPFSEYVYGCKYQCKLSASGSYVCGSTRLCRYLKELKVKE